MGFWEFVVLCQPMPLHGQYLDVLVPHHLEYCFLLLLSGGEEPLDIYGGKGGTVITLVWIYSTVTVTWFPPPVPVTVVVWAIPSGTRARPV